MRFLPVLTIVILSMSLHLHAKEECFRGKMNLFQPYLKLKADRMQLRDMLAHTCRDLSDPENHDTHIMDGVDVVGSKIIFATFGHAYSAFESLDDTQLERQYMNRLNNIKSIESPMERIRLVYELSTSIQGYYDKSEEVGGVTPATAIANSEKYGTIGVCRDYSSLLAWSLLQVSRHSESRTMHLGPNDFSAEMYPMIRKKHAWVRVNLPRHNNQGQLLGFQRFDIDPTWYPERFHMLMPRHIGISDETRIKALNQCKKIRSCLIK